MRTIQYKGHFVFLVSALGAGDEQSIRRYEIEGSAPWTRLGFSRAEWLSSQLRVLEECKVGRVSNTGWYTIDHPILKQLSFKIGRTYKKPPGYTGDGYFLLLRLSGRMVLNTFPKPSELYA